MQRGASLLRELILQLVDGLGQWMVLPSAAENFIIIIVFVFVVIIIIIIIIIRITGSDTDSTRTTLKCNLTRSG